MNDEQKQEERIRELTKNKLESEKEITRLKAEMSETILKNNPVLTKFMMDMQSGMASNNFEKARRAGQQFYLHLVRPKSMKKKSAVEHMAESGNIPEGFALPEEWGLRAKLHNSHVNAVGGFAGMGKSTTLNNLMHSAYRRKKSVMIFSYEMTPGQIFNRLCAIEIYHRTKNSVNYYEMMHLFLGGDKLIEKILVEMDDYITIIPSKNFDILDTMVFSQIYEDRHGCPSMYLFDYVQKIKPAKEGRDRRMEMIEVMNKLTLEAESSNAAYVIAAQTNRGSFNGGRAADHSGFQESAAIEQDSALTLMIGRIKKDNSETEYLELSIPKNRFGATGRSHVRIDKESGAILDRVDDQEVMEYVKSQKARK